MSDSAGYADRFQAGKHFTRTEDLVVVIDRNKKVLGNNASQSRSIRLISLIRPIRVYFLMPASCLAANALGVLFLLC